MSSHPFKDESSLALSKPESGLPHCVAGRSRFLLTISRFYHKRAEERPAIFTVCNCSSHKFSQLANLHEKTALILTDSQVDSDLLHITLCTFFEHGPLSQDEAEAPNGLCRRCTFSYLRDDLRCNWRKGESGAWSNSQNCVTVTQRLLTYHQR